MHHLQECNSSLTSRVEGLRPSELSGLTVGPFGPLPSSFDPEMIYNIARADQSRPSLGRAQTMRGRSPRSTCVASDLRIYKIRLFAIMYRVEEYSVFLSFSPPEKCLLRHFDSALTGHRLPEPEPPAPAFG